MNELFTAEELATLENAGMPQPVSPEKLATITEAIHEDYHSEIVVCAVCDEMFSHSETKLFGNVNFEIGVRNTLDNERPPSQQRVGVELYKILNTQNL